MEELLSKPAIKSELKEMESRLFLAISDSARKQTLATLAIVAFSVAIIVLLLK